MSQLKTSYMGLELNSPVIAGASSLTANLESIKKIAEAGAGAIVMKSLFEEQIQQERLRLEEDLDTLNNWNAEMSAIFPGIEHAGPAEHLMWVRKAKELVDVPVIGSLNAVEKESWIEYAKQLVETGIDALELNFYSVPTDLNKSGADMEVSQIDIIKAVKDAVDIPVSIKLSPYYTNPLNFIKQIDEAGVDGLVLFNRLFQPSFNILKEENDLSLNLSGENDYRLPLRFAGMLSGNVKASICASNGITDSDKVIQAILAGADVIQMVTGLFRNKVKSIGTVNSEIMEWMDKKGYKSLDDFKGKLNMKNNSDEYTYTRSQYVRALMHPERILVQRTV